MKLKSGDIVRWVGFETLYRVISLRRGRGGMQAALAYVAGVESGHICSTSCTTTQHVSAFLLVKDLELVGQE